MKCPPQQQRRQMPLPGATILHQLFGLVATLFSYLGDIYGVCLGSLLPFIERPLDPKVMSEQILVVEPFLVTVFIHFLQRK